MGIERDPQYDSFDQVAFDDFYEQIRGAAFPGTIVFERQLSNIGFTKRLEEARILPVVENPNPYNPDDEPELFQQWWDNHPGESEKFVNSTEERQKALRYLYIGTVLGREYPGLMPRE